MSYDGLNPDARSLEEAFFAKQNARLLEKLREKEQMRQKREALKAVAPHADDATIDHFIALELSPGTVLAITLIPLAFVAWADGKMEERERNAILKAAEERGVQHGTPAHEVLESWLDHKPGPELLDLWKRYVHSLAGSFTEEERTAMRERLVGMARTVAKSAGSFLGITSGISAEEQAVLNDLEQALS